MSVARTNRLKMMAVARQKSTTHFTRDTWNAPDDAPRNGDVMVKVTDGVSTYILPFPCRCESGRWTNAQGAPLSVQVIGWRFRDWSAHG